MFEPKALYPERDIIYERLASMEIDEVVTYEELDELLERDFRSDRSPLHKAVQDLLKANQRTLVCVQGVGYRMAHPREHTGIATAKVRRARRMIKRSVDVTENADRSLLSPEESKALDATSLINKTLLNSVRRQERRMVRASQAASMTTRAQNDAAIIADAQRRLERSQQRS